MLAGAIFKRVRKIAAHEDEAPKATGAQRSWREVRPAAAPQGAVFALVRAAVDRGAAEGIRKLTGAWPGEEGPATVGALRGQCGGWPLSGRWLCRVHPAGAVNVGVVTSAGAWAEISC
jgi:hypothetical protein